MDSSGWAISVLLLPVWIEHWAWLGCLALVKYSVVLTLIPDVCKSLTTCVLRVKIMGQLVSFCKLSLPITYFLVAVLAKYQEVTVYCSCVDLRSCITWQEQIVWTFKFKPANSCISDSFHWCSAIEAFLMFPFLFGSVLFMSFPVGGKRLVSPCSPTSAYVMSPGWQQHHRFGILLQQGKRHQNVKGSAWRHIFEERKKGRETVGLVGNHLVESKIGGGGHRLRCVRNQMNEVCVRYEDRWVDIWERK